MSFNTDKNIAAKTSEAGANETNWELFATSFGCAGPMTSIHLFIVTRPGQIASSTWLSAC
jgi:hypothetical protein